MTFFCKETGFSPAQSGFCTAGNLTSMVRSGLEWPNTVAHCMIEMNNVISQQVECLLIFNSPR